MIREYSESDLDRAVHIWLESGKEEYAYLPEFQKLSHETAKPIFIEAIQSRCSIWLAERNAEVVGLMALEGAYVDRLYVLPDQQRLGVGSQLLEFAKELHRSGLELHTHQQNKRARAFYEKHGFSASQYGISPPPECVPDVRYRWDRSTR